MSLFPEMWFTEASIKKRPVTGFPAFTVSKQALCSSSCSFPPQPMHLMDHHVRPGTECKTRQEQECVVKKHPMIHSPWRIKEDRVVLSFQQKWVPSLYTLPCKSSSSSHWKLQPERVRWAQKGGWLVCRAVGFLNNTVTIEQWTIMFDQFKTRKKLECVWRNDLKILL